MSQIILNRIQTPDGTILTSYHVHDYKSHIDRSGKMYSVDGGTSYLKRSGHSDYTELSLYGDQPFEVIRKNLHWGVNMDKDKNLLPKTLWKPICGLNTDHIKAILDNGYGVDWIREYFKQELKYRNEQ